MNKYQEALDDLSYPDSSSLCYGCKCGESDCGDCNIKKDILTLKELVDRATPKKPNKETDSVYGTSYYCSNCGSFITRIINEQRKEEIFNKNKGCKHCLHEIDWSEEE